MEMPSSFDPNQTQWYPADPAAPSAQPSGEDPEHKKKKMIRYAIGGGMGVLVLVLSIFFFRTWMESRAQPEKIRAEKKTGAVQACDETQDPEKCTAAIPEKLARTEGDAKYCAEITEGEQKDACLFLAAFTAKEIDVCEMISDASKKDDCHDAILTVQLQKNGRTEESCAEYRNTDAQNSCVSLILWDLAAAGDCSDERISRDLCDAAKYTTLALSTHDPEACGQIHSDDLEADCRDRVGPGDVDADGLDADTESENGSSDHLVDTDGDGLTDKQEIETYLTNPAKSDTDGDGYPDGTEVAGGYDPLH